MKAAVLYSARDLRVEEVPDAPLPRPGEVRIRVLRCGLCGTDVHEYDSAPVLAPLVTRNPFSGHLGKIIPGHEFLGVVEDSGDGVDLVPGQRVVSGAGVWCGECTQCLRGRTNLCASYYTHGLQIDGGLAEFVTVPAKTCVVVPEECSDDDAVLAQPVAIALHAVQRAEVGDTDRVAVIGAGGIGSLLVTGLVATGATITVLDVDPQRLATAQELGAHDAVLVPAESVAARAQADRLAASFDIVFDASGIRSGLTNALGMTRKGGRIVAVGLPSGEVAFDSRAAVIKEIDVVTSSAHVCRQNLPAALALLTTRSIHDLIVDRTIPLDDIVSQGLEPLGRRAVAGKVIVRVGRASEHQESKERQAR